MRNCLRVCAHARACVKACARVYVDIDSYHHNCYILDTTAFRLHAAPSGVVASNCPAVRRSTAPPGVVATNRPAVRRSAAPPGESAAGARLVLSEEDLSEGEPEVGAEDGVDDRVEETVEVAEPTDDALDERRDAARLAAKRHDGGDDEEGQPGADEGASDDGQGARRLPLPLQFLLLLGALARRRRRALPLEVPLGDVEQARLVLLAAARRRRQRRRQARRQRRRQRRRQARLGDVGDGQVRHARRPVGRRVAAAVSVPRGGGGVPPGGVGPPPLPTGPRARRHLGGGGEWRRRRRLLAEALLADARLCDLVDADVENEHEE